MSRRTCLSLFGVAAFSGCLSGDEQYPGLAQISVYNYNEREIEARVTVAKDDEPVYEQTHVLDGVDSANQKIDAAIIEEPWMKEDAFYEVTAEVPSVGKDAFTTEDFLNFGGDNPKIECFHLTISVEQIIDFPIGVPEDECWSE